MKPSLRSKLDTISLRLEEMNALLSAEDVTRDLDRYRALSREHAEVEPVACGGVTIYWIVCRDPSA